MLPTTVNLCDAGLVCNLNFLRFELILKLVEAECAMHALTPTIDRAIITAYETRIATASNLGDMAHWDVLDEYR